MSVSGEWKGVTSGEEIVLKFEVAKFGDEIRGLGCLMFDAQMSVSDEWKGVAGVERGLYCEKR